MIQNPVLLVLIFCAVIQGVTSLSGFSPARKFFKYLPVPLWCYFIPTVLSTAGVIPSDSPFYALMSRTLLPACLVLLLVGTHLPSIFRLGKKALLAMLLGSAGIAAGAMVSYVILMKLKGADPGWIGTELWMGWGCLSASWTGGSANMIAVREILQTPESLFSNLIVTDATIAYGWMAVLVISSEYQEWINGKLGAREDETAHGQTGPEPAPVREPGNEGGTGIVGKASAVIGLLFFGFLTGYLCWALAAYCPSWGAVLNRFTWTVILATAIPLGLSATKLRALEDHGAGKIGTFLLYLLLTSVGARANLAALGQAPYFIAAGLLWVAIHGVILLAFGRIFRIPLSLLATASQANVGGTVSAPLVASIYRKDLAPVGVILAVLGNIYGTYFGLVIAQICRALANVLQF